jgi:hypothetical protein
MDPRKKTERLLGQAVIDALREGSEDGYVEDATKRTTIDGHFDMTVVARRLLERLRAFEF